MSAPSEEPRQRQESHPSRRGWWIAGTILSALGIAAAIAIPLSLRSGTALVMRRQVIAVVTSQGQALAPPSAQIDVRTTVTAPVERVGVTVGQRVSRGQALVEFYHPTVEEARREALVELQQAQRDYAQAQETYRGQLEAARRQLADAQAEARQARQALAQAPGAQPGGVPAAAPSSGPARRGVGGVRLVEVGPTPPVPATPPSLQQALADVQQAELAVARAKVELDRDLAPYQQQLDQARAALQRANEGRQRATVTAPISGTVLVLNAQPGQPVSGNGSRRGPALLARIADLRALQVQAPLSASQASTMEPGRPATLVFRDLPGQRHQGHVARAVTQARPGGSGPEYLAVVDFSNANGAVKPDMVADVSIEVGRASNVLAVPNAAVRTDDQGRRSVRVRRGGAWHTQRVTTGLRGNHYTEITSGLREGDTVRV
jgi:multidrug efflux pump subunit AcrA (membrane-fusion protein)